MANEVVTRQPTGIASYLNSDAAKDNIMSVVGEKDTARFISSVVSAVQTTPALQKCTKASILNAALLGHALNLSPSPQLAMYYMVPYKNKGTDEAQFQLGWKGYVQLAIRSGQYRRIVASEVREGEIKEFNPITEEFRLDPVLDVQKRESLPVVGYYAMLELMNGFRKEIYWTKEKMSSHAIQYSKGYASDIKNGNSYTFWSKNFDDMAKKTMLRQLISKWGIMSIDMQQAFESDMAVIDADGNKRYVDNTDYEPEVENPFSSEVIIDEQ